MSDNHDSEDPEDLASGDDNPGDDENVIRWEDIKREVEETYAQYGLSEDDVDEIELARSEERDPKVSDDKIAAYDRMEADRKKRIQEALERLGGSAALREINESVRRAVAGSIPKINLPLLGLTVPKYNVPVPKYTFPKYNFPIPKYNLPTLKLGIDVPQISPPRNHATDVAADVIEDDGVGERTESTKVYPEAVDDIPTTSEVREQDRLEGAATLHILNVLEQQLKLDTERRDSEKEAATEESNHRKREACKTTTNLVLVALTLLAAVAVPLIVLAIQSGGLSVESPTPAPSGSFIESEKPASVR